ncbi:MULTISPECIES: DUF3820 family protein [Flavobacterium]|jgi:uncharacterized protein (DUF3820 family)|uniref:DUF3820 family protein n=1 Tax=Flavobacterium jumunjinense TaxID=998845 RepID=A0ABV5GT83_9FLAO|nr:MULTISPECIES: DUF3820 family protein [Flavobacterium]
MTNQEQLVKLAHAKMPFGKYKDKYLIDLPEFYVVWYSNKGFPKGQLGEQLQLVYELKLNGLEDLVRNIRRNFPKK